MKDRIRNYIVENFDDLLALDLKVARILGAPAPHTLSSYAYLLECRASWWGCLWRFVIDKIFLWLFEQKDHCKVDYERVVK